MPTVYPIDNDLVVKSAKKTGKIVTVEEHYRDGGLGTLVSEVCSQEFPVPVKRVGVPKEYASSGPYDQLLKYYGLDEESIEKTVTDFLRVK
jgi:transketolase